MLGLRRRGPGWWGLLAVLGGCAGPVRATAYTYHKMADLGFPFVPPLQTPSLNESCSVAFSILPLLGSGLVCVAHADGTGTMIAQTGAEWNMLAGSSINDAGDVAFMGLLAAGGGGIYLGNGGPVTPVAQDTDGFSDLGYPWLSDSGKVAFWGERGKADDGLYIGDAGGFSRLVDTSGDFLHLGPPSINVGNEVAFYAELDAGGSGIYRAGSPLTPIAVSGGDFTGFGGDPSINDAGTVAFEGYLSTGAEGIFIGSGGAPTPYATADGDYHYFGFPSINNHGAVAFLAELDTGLGGIYAGPDPAADKVVDQNDLLDGEAISMLWFYGRQSFNDRGQVLFAAATADGGLGVYVATPRTAVPEPSSLALLSAGLIGALLRRRRGS